MTIYENVGVGGAEEKKRKKKKKKEEMRESPIHRLAWVEFPVIKKAHGAAINSSCKTPLLKQNATSNK